MPAIKRNLVLDMRSRRRKCDANMRLMPAQQHKHRKCGEASHRASWAWGKSGVGESRGWGKDFA